MESFRTPLIIGFEGVSLTSSLRNHLLAVNPAGVILFKRNIKSLDQVKGLIAEIKSLLGEIIVAIDHEGGVVSRFPADCPVPPSAQALAWSGSPQMTEEACRMQAQLAAHLGFNLNFTPVLDLAVDGRNQVIGTRAFSGDPRQVAQYGQVSIDVHESFMVGSSAKHFPGHGRTAQDSHFATGVVDHSSQAQLDDDLLPFKRAIAAGVPTIMTAHLVYKQLDPGTTATFSQPILTDLLRSRLGFQGLIISDCVEMAGIGEMDTPEKIIAAGIQAGLDLFISSYSLKKSVDFQRSLNDAFTVLVEKEQERLKASQNRLTQFITRYEKNSVVVPALPSLENCLDLHRKTVQKVSFAPLPRTHQKFFLIELANRELSGINADQNWNVVCQEIFKSCPSVKGQELISKCDKQRLESVVAECNRQSLTAVLLSYNGFRNEGYVHFVKALAALDSAIHIALLDPGDLQGNCANEWTTRGFNSCTGKAIAQELSRLC